MPPQTPLTPGQTPSSRPPCTPSPRKRAEMKASFNQLPSDKKKQAMNAITHLQGLLLDKNVPPSTREACTYFAQKSIDHVMQEEGFDFEEVTTLAQPQFKDIPNGIIIDDDNIDPEGELQAQQYLSQRFRTKVAEGPELVTQAWEQELHKSGLRQGNGQSDENPKFVGGRTLTEAPMFIEVDIDASTTLTVDRIKEIQQELFVAFTNIVWKTLNDRVPTYLRLHSWAATNWVNFFTAELFGTRALAKVNTLITATTKTNEYGENDKDVMKARALSRKQDLTLRERQFYESLANTIEKDLKKTAFTRFKQYYDAATFCQLLQDMIAEVKDGANTPLFRSLKAQYGGIGVNNRYLVNKVVADNMGWTTDHLHEFVERHAVVGECAGYFSGGILLFMTEKMLTMSRNNGKSCIIHLVETVRTIIPELGEFMAEFDAKIGRKLLSLDQDELAAICTKRIDTSADGPDMLTRLQAM